MKRILFSALLLYTFSGGIAYGFEFTPNCRAAYHEMLQLNFNAAGNHLAKEKISQPGNAAVSYIEHYADFLKAFISEEDGDFQELKTNFDKRISSIDKTTAVSPWINLAKGEMLMQLAILKLKRKEYLSAGYYIRRSYKLLEENQKKFPGFLPNLKALGFFHAIIGAVPENYKWLANLAGLHGTIAQGAKELNMLIREVDKNEELSFIREETYFIKIFIATHFEKDYDTALGLLEKIRKTSAPDNPLITFLAANTLVVVGKPADAHAVLKSFEPAKTQYSFYYLSYLSGMLRLNNLDMQAAGDFSKFIEGFKGKSFIKSACHKMAWICLMKNDTAGYHEYLQKVKIMGDDFTDEDKQALKEANSAIIPNIYLLRARLLFDGGNFNAALAELAGKPPGNFTTFRDQLEFTYRLARIFDKRGQTDKAIQYYTSTYENGMRSEFYFAANSALNNGLIYEIKGDKTSALQWFNKCLALRNHEYQNSIDQKAEAGVNRIRNN